MARLREISVVVGTATGVATLGRMIREFRRDGALSRPTAALLDALYVAHFAGVWSWASDDPARLRLPADVARVAGTAAAVSGALMMGAGMRLFPTGTQINARGDEELVTDGIYRYSRNPQYVGWSLVVAGVALARRSPRGLALAALYPVAVRAWVPHEEQHLRRAFGDEFEEYLRVSARWFGPPRGSPGRPG